MAETAASPETAPSAATAASFGLEAVRAALPEHPALAAASSFLVDGKYQHGELTLTVAPESIVAAMGALQQAGYNFLEDVTCVDWYPTEPRFQMTYHVLSHSFKHRVRVVARLAEGATIASVTGLWPSANFYEREVFDLFGVPIGGHPNLKRIMMPENWQGHPLRKDYPVEGYR